VQSGYPLLRPASDAVAGAREAVQYLPWTSTTDLRATWDFGSLRICGGCSWRLVFDGRNILNRKNILALRSNTGALSPTLADVQQLANSQTVPDQPIPRESPSYVVFLDANRDGVISPDEARNARFAAALDRFDPTLFFGEARQVRFGIEVAF
jgi:hypothetical protein